MNNSLPFIDSISLIKMNFSNSESKNFKNFVDKYLVNKPYPTKAELLLSKYWYSKFYCSSLVWRAHYSS